MTDPFRPEVLGSSADGLLRLRLHGPARLSGLLQRSTTLSEWQDWQPLALDGAPVLLTDPILPGGTRLYRFLAP